MGSPYGEQELFPCINLLRGLDERSIISMGGRLVANIGAVDYGATPSSETLENAALVADCLPHGQPFTGAAELIREADIAVIACARNRASDLCPFFCSNVRQEN